MHFLRQIGGNQAVTQLLSLGPFGTGLAQFSLNSPELLAEKVFPLLLAHLVLSLARDLLPQLQHLQLLGQVAMDQPETLETRRCFEQRLLLRHVQAHHRPDEKGQNQGIRRLGRELFDIESGFRMRQLDARPVNSRTARRRASTSGPVSSGSGSGLTRNRR